MFGPYERRQVRDAGTDATWPRNMIIKEGTFTAYAGEYTYYGLIEQHSAQQILDEEQEVNKTLHCDGECAHRRGRTWTVPAENLLKRYGSFQCFASNARTASSAWSASLNGIVRSEGSCSRACACGLSAHHVHFQISSSSHKESAKTKIPVTFFHSDIRAKRHPRSFR